MQSRQLHQLGGEGRHEPSELEQSVDDRPRIRAQTDAARCVDVNEVMNRGSNRAVVALARR